MARILTPACIADGPTITASTPTSCVPVRCPLTFEPGYLTEGATLRLRMSGKISTSILDGLGTLNQSPGTARFDLRLGGVVVWDSLAVPLNTALGLTNVPWVLSVELRCRAIGSAATLIGTGTWHCIAVKGGSAVAAKASANAVLPWNTAPVVGAAFDSYARLGVDVFFTQTVGTGSLTVSGYSLEEV